MTSSDPFSTTSRTWIGRHICHGRYETDGQSTSWLKVKNPTYSHMVGRRELFEARRDVQQRRRRDRRQPVLRLSVTHHQGHSPLKRYRWNADRPINPVIHRETPSLQKRPDWRLLRC